MNLTCQQECRGLTGNSNQQKAAWKHNYLQGKKGSLMQLSAEEMQLIR